MSEPKTTRLLDRVVPQFTEAFEKHSMGERVTWDLSMQAFPDPSQSTQPGQQPAFIGVMVLYLEMRGTVLGTVMCNTTLHQPFSLTPEYIDAVVQQLVTGMLNERTTQLQQMQTQQEQAHTNGGKSPTSGGLMMPGQS